MVVLSFSWSYKAYPTLFGCKNERLQLQLSQPNILKISYLTKQGQQAHVAKGSSHNHYLRYMIL